MGPEHEASVVHTQRETAQKDESELALGKGCLKRARYLCLRAIFMGKAEVLSHKRKQEIPGDAQSRKPGLHCYPLIYMICTQEYVYLRQRY